MGPKIGTRRIAAGRVGLLLALALAPSLGCSMKEQTEIAIELPADVPAGLELKWAAVKGADRYRMVFTRMTGAPVCTLFVDAQKEPVFIIQRDSLPDHLAHGWQLDMTMQAMKRDRLMAATGFRPLRIP